MDAAAAARIAKLDEVLRQVPYQYQQKDRLRNDVAGLLRVCHTLQPQTGSFSGNGRQVTLFYLYGVLPISYRGSTYNIPVTIYFDPPYPRAAPRCFVTPTSTMAVSKNHPNVDQGGMVYAPFLTQWSERSSSLQELVAVMTSLFAANPPVYLTTPSAAAAARPTEATQAHYAESGLIGAIGGLLGLGQQHAAVQPLPAVAVPVQPVPAQPAVAAHVVAQPVQARPVTQQPNRKEVLVQQATQALKERWPFILEPIVAEANEQLERRTQLRAEAKHVEEELAAIKGEEARETAQAGELEALELELSLFVAASEGKEPDPDELRDTLSPDSRQVLDLLAEELALEELLVALDELLGARKVSLDDFLREVRDVSRRRFMCQVQRQKAEAAVRAAAAEAPTAPPLPLAAKPIADAGGRRVLAVV